MEFSFYLSIIAIIISAVSLYISWRQYSRDRSNLKLNLDFHVRTGKGSAYTLTVVNIGRRTTTLRAGFARLNTGKAYPIYDTPVLLEETGSKEFLIPLYGFHTISHPLDIVAFEVEDTTGVRYQVRTKTLRKKIQKEWSPEVDWLTK